METVIRDNGGLDIMVNSAYPEDKGLGKQN